MSDDRTAYWGKHTHARVHTRTHKHTKGVVQISAWVRSPEWSSASLRLRLLVRGGTPVLQQALISPSHPRCLAALQITSSPGRLLSSRPPSPAASGHLPFMSQHVLNRIHHLPPQTCSSFCVSCITNWDLLLPSRLSQKSAWKLRSPSPSA